VLAGADSQFHKALQTSDLIIPDGVGIIVASKILGGNIRRRITGSDIFYGISEVLNKEKKGKHSYFFLGSTEQSLSDIRKKLSSDYPNIRFAGSYPPPYTKEFSEKESRLMIENINRARPEILWVGMTAPKQEKWIFENKEKLNVKFIAAIGAVFDFYTGKVKRSPIFYKTGLEWLSRLIQEPHHLWRRTFVSLPKFMLKVFAHRLEVVRVKSS
jgi:N-acetylglucosaminyldiphosphoundecaprenol N-acetyl-beta-D-mannosaminyltransferase